jgi:hypothetical protein
MRAVRRAIFLATLVAILREYPAAADEGSSTLTERITAAVSRDQPSWKVSSPLKICMSCLQPSASGVWEGAGHRIELGLHAYPSSQVAADDLAHMWRVDNGGNPPPQSSGRRHFRKANVTVWIQIAPINYKDKTEESSRTASVLATRLAEIVENLIVTDVKVDGCVNELFPPPQPPPASPREEFFRDVESGCLDRVARALASGVDANARDSHGTPVLYEAVTKGHRDVVRQLLRRGANPNSVAGYNGTAMFRLLWGPPSYRPADLPTILADRIGILDDLLEYGADIEAPGSGGRTLLLEVAHTFGDGGERSTVFLRALIQRGANLAARDHEGRTALMLAAQATSPKGIEMLLAAGADVNARDAEGKTALGYARERAARYGYKESASVLQILADAGGAE